MAVPNLSEIVTTTLRNRSGTLADNVSRNNALLGRLNKSNRIKPFSGGRTIVQELDFADNATFNWYSGYQTINIAPSITFTAAEFPIRQAALAISISGLEEIQNSSDEAVIDLLESRVENGERTFLNGLTQGVYGDGTVTGSIGGLQLLVATTPTTGVVGGIDRSVWTFWQNIAWSAATNGNTTLNSATIQQQMDALWVQLIRGRDYPDLIIADNNTYRFYLASLQSIQRIQEENTESAELGFPMLKYLQADVVLDGGFQGFSNDPLPGQTSTSPSAVGGAASSTMYFLNSHYLFWRPHARRNLVPLDPDRFSTNQDALIRLLGWAGNLTMSCAFLQGTLGA